MEHDQNPFLSPEAETLGRQSISQRGLTLEDVLRTSGATAPPESLNVYPVDPVCMAFYRQSYEDPPGRQGTPGVHRGGKMLSVYLVYIPIFEDGSHENS